MQFLKKSPVKKSMLIIFAAVAADLLGVDLDCVLSSVSAVIDAVSVVL